MAELPPTIDAILASIRARVTGAEGDTLAPDSDTDAADAMNDGEHAAIAPAPPPVPLAELGRVALPAEVQGMTLDALIRQMMEPMLKAWLDANMPEIVEKLARDEIKRLTSQV